MRMNILSVLTSAVAALATFIIPSAFAQETDVVSQEEARQAFLENARAGSGFSLSINGVEAVFRYCPPGTFTMGSPSSEDKRDENETQRQVTFERGFLAMETETTQKLWKVVMGTNPSNYIGDDLPVEEISWGDCQRFIEKLNYFELLPKGMKFSLPTEAQWEYACRAGTSTSRYWGDDAIGTEANFYGAEDYTYQTVPVKSYRPNDWKLYDMMGNVYEWCLDSFAPYPTTDQTEPFVNGENTTRVVRGGSFYDAPEYCRSARRAEAEPTRCSEEIGLRLFIVADVENDSLTVSSKTSVSKNAKSGDAFSLTIEGIEATFRYCPAGTFIMGSPKDEAGRGADETRHKVTLTRGFWMMETEVPQNLWIAVMKKEPCPVGKANEPVTASWDECQQFVEKLNSYLPKGMSASLPTEAQWEYACRAGADSPFPWGGALNGDNANCNGRRPYGTNKMGNNLHQVAPVKSYEPNAWNLYDMCGNLYEWCADAYAPYPSAPQTDPIVKQGDARRVIRGGSYREDARSCRSAARRRCDPTYRLGAGFRCVLTIEKDETK